MLAEIVTAHSYSPKYGTFTLAGYVLESHYKGLPKGHTFKVLTTKVVGVDLDVLKVEMRRALHSGNVRHPSNMEVTYKGRLPQSVVDGYTF